MTFGILLTSFLDLVRTSDDNVFKLGLSHGKYSIMVESLSSPKVFGANKNDPEFSFQVDSDQQSPCHRRDAKVGGGVSMLM